MFDLLSEPSDEVCTLENLDAPPIEDDALVVLRKVRIQVRSVGKCVELGTAADEASGGANRIDGKATNKVPAQQSEMICLPDLLDRFSQRLGTHSLPALKLVVDRVNELLL